MVERTSLKGLLVGWTVTRFTGSILDAIRRHPRVKGSECHKDLISKSHFKVNITNFNLDGFDVDKLSMLKAMIKKINPLNRTAPLYCTYKELKNIDKCICDLTAVIVH